MGIAFVLLVLADPLWAGNRRRGETSMCLENLRRLTRSWHGFTADHGGYFAGNSDYESRKFVPGSPDWAWLRDRTSRRSR
jgi:hypothetical protein